MWRILMNKNRSRPEAVETYCEREQAGNITKIHRLKLGPTAGVDIAIIPRRSRSCDNVSALKCYKLKGCG